MEENHIGREIAKQRFSRSLSRDGLALYTGISAERLAVLERGEALPDAAELSSLAEFFGVSADQLLGIEKNAPERPQFRPHFRHDAVRAFAFRIRPLFRRAAFGMPRRRFGVFIPARRGGGNGNCNLALARFRRLSRGRARMDVFRRFRAEYAEHGVYRPVLPKRF